jgi:hypothetical protein
MTVLRPEDRLLLDARAESRGMRSATNDGAVRRAQLCERGVLWTASLRAGVAHRRAASSCASGPQGRERAGRAAGVTRVRETESVVLMGFHAHVRFRSFRDELSLTENHLRRLQDSQPGFRGKTGNNPGGLDAVAAGKWHRIRRIGCLGDDTERR